MAQIITDKKWLQETRDETITVDGRYRHKDKELFNVTLNHTHVPANQRQSRDKNGDWLYGVALKKFLEKEKYLEEKR